MTEITEGMTGNRALRERLVFLRDATAKIGASSCLDEAVRGLGRALVPLLADSATVHLLDRRRDGPRHRPRGDHGPAADLRADARGAGPASRAGAAAPGRHRATAR